jgi:flagellar hook protein FlgE
MTTLAQAISDAPGLTATVTGGRLYVSADNPNLQLTFANGDATGNGTLAGVNWIQELDLNAPPITNSTNYFNSLQSLANEINIVDPTNLTASITNPTGASTLTINEANPEQTISFTDGTDASAVSPGSILKELGIANLAVDPTVSTKANTTGTLPIVYSPASATQDMSSGSVTPQFSKDVTVYDAQGNSHTIAMNFVKISTNTWAMELTAVPTSDVDSTIKNASGVGDGQVASGILTFNGDGELTSVTGTIANSNIPINWTNGAAPSQLTLNLGVGTDTGLIQSAAAFNVSTAQQNGSPVGELTGVSINANGFVVASFSNGQTQNLYQVPLASVNNPDGLEAVSGNAYIQTVSSGIANLEIPGTSGVGTFTPSALEDSNVDLSTQLTDLIVAQQAYGANSKVLTVADSLLQELDQIIQ